MPVVLRFAITALALAVLICLALPMAEGDGAMTMGLMCCFILVVLLSIFLLARPHPTLLLYLGRGTPRRPLRRISATARAPDPVALGALLI